MEMPFLDQLSDNDIAIIEEDIRDHLFNTWYDNYADEGPEALEEEIMSFASARVRKEYNEFYKLNPGDEGYLLVLGDNL